MNEDKWAQFDARFKASKENIHAPRWFAPLKVGTIILCIAVASLLILKDDPEPPKRTLGGDFNKWRRKKWAEFLGVDEKEIIALKNKESENDSV